MELKPIAWMSKEKPNIIYHSDGFDANYSSKFIPLYTQSIIEPKAKRACLNCLKKDQEIVELKLKLASLEEKADFHYDLYIDVVGNYDFLLEHMKSVMEMPEIQEILKKTPTYNNSGEKTNQSYCELLKSVINDE